MQIHLASPIDVSGFRAQSTRMLAGQVMPETIAWQADASQAFEAAVDAADSRPLGGRSAARAIVPRSFVRLTELVVLHRDAARFGLLYRLLWRMVHEPRLNKGGHDGDIAMASSMAHAVRRDIYKMKAGLRLRPIGSLDGAPLLFGWYEPAHHISEEIASWLAEVHGDASWFLTTPDRCVLRHRGRLRCGPVVPFGQAPAQDDDAGWLQAARRFAAAEAS